MPKFVDVRDCFHRLCTHRLMHHLKPLTANELGLVGQVMDGRSTRRFARSLYVVQHIDEQTRFRFRRERGHVAPRCIDGVVRRPLPTVENVSANTRAALSSGQADIEQAQEAGSSNFQAEDLCSVLRAIETIHFSLSLVE